MTGYLVSVFMGLAVGTVYGLVQVRFPAPLMIALVGLFGMVLGQQSGRYDEAPFRATGPNLHSTLLGAMILLGRST
jgi:XapX domain-containing protein